MRTIENLTEHTFFPNNQSAHLQLIKYHSSYLEMQIFKLASADILK